MRSPERWTGHLGRPAFVAVLSLALASALIQAAAAPIADAKDPRAPAEIQLAREDLRGLKTLLESPPSDLADVWMAWQAFRLKHAGSPEWVRAAEIMSSAPSPLDQLDRGQIPLEDRPPWLPKEVVAVLGQLRGRHDFPIYQVAISSDGRLTATAAPMETIRIWDTETVREQTVLRGARCMALSPDGHLLAAGGGDGDGTTIHVWDIREDKFIERVVVHGEGWTTDLLFLASDNKTLVALDSHRGYTAVRVLDISTARPKELYSWKRGNGDDTCAAVAARSMTFVDSDGSAKTRLRIWDLDAKPPQIRCQVATDRQDPKPIALSPDGNVLAARDVKKSTTIVLWDVSGGEAKTIAALDGHVFTTLAFAPDGRVLAAAGNDGMLRLWPVNDIGRKDLGLQDDQTHAAFPLGFQATSMAFSSDGKTLVLGGEDHILHVWDVRQQSERFPPPRGHLGRVWSLAFAPDGKTLASGGEDAVIRLWDLTGATAKEVGKLEGHKYGIADLAFAPDGKLLASAGSPSLHDSSKDDPTVRLWDMAGRTPRAIGSWQPHSNVESVAFHPGGGLLVTSGTDWRDAFSREAHAGVRVWDVSSFPPTERASLLFIDRDGQGDLPGVEAAVQAVYSPRGDALAFRSGERTVRVYSWAANGLKERQVVQPNPQKVTALAMSPDGATLAIAGWRRGDDDGFGLWKWGGKELAPLSEFQPESYPGADWLAFSPDGKRLAAVNWTSGFSVYEVPTGRLVYRWETTNGPIRAVFAPDGRHLAVANPNGTVYIFRLPDAPAKASP